MGSYYIYILLAVVVLAAGILSFKQGFWDAITSMTAFALSGFIGMTFVLPLSKMLGEGGYSQGLAIAILIVGSLVILILFQTRGPKAKHFLPKQLNAIFSILLLLVTAVCGLMTIQTITKYNKQEQAAPAPAAIPADAAADGANANMPQDALPQEQAAPANGLHFNQQAVDAFSKGVPLLVTAALFYLFWCWTGSWVSNDSEKLELSGRYIWKLAAALAFPVFALVAFLLPILPVAIALVIVGYLIPSVAYVIVRNKKCDPDSKVLTPHHLAGLLKGKKSKSDASTGDGLPIEMTGYGDNMPKSVRKEHGAAFNKFPAHVTFAMTVYQALKRKATAMRLVSNGTELVIHYFLDGCWQQMPPVFAKPIPAEEAVHVLEALKVLIGGNPEEVQARQSGRFYMEYDNRGGKKKKMAATAIIQPQGNIEEVQIQFEMLHLRFGTYQRLGMSEKRIEQIQDLMKTDQGLIVFSAPPGHGLRTLTDIAMTNADRFTRDFVTVEDEAHPYRTLENVVKTTYNSANGETPMTVLKDVFFKEPRVLLIRDLVNRETLELCCQEIANQRLIFTTIRARNSAEAILRLLHMGLDPKMLADTLTAVISQRLVRILCPICKEQTAANPEIFRRLGINPMYTDCLFKPHTEEIHSNSLCPECFGFGFKKRTGIYDVITISDEMRRVLTTNPTEAAIRAAAAKQGEHGFLVDGGRLVGWGATSYEELVRCLK